MKLKSKLSHMSGNVNTFHSSAVNQPCRHLGTGDGVWNTVLPSSCNEAASNTISPTCFSLPEPQTNAESTTPSSSPWNHYNIDIICLVVFSWLSYGVRTVIRCIGQLTWTTAFDFAGFRPFAFLLIRFLDLVDASVFGLMGYRPLASLKASLLH